MRLKLTATRNNRGFTLVEVMIAMLVLLVGLLGSLAGVMAAADHNLGNALRNEAIKIAQEQLENLRVGRYDALAAGTIQVQRQVRKALHPFQVETTITPNDSITQIGVTVRWTFKNRPSRVRRGNDHPAAHLLISARGLTMVELMVTLVVVMVVIAAASTAYLQLFGGFKVQGRISDTQMDTLCGFELLRYDVEMAGYGLPFDMNSLTYAEATTSPASAYNDAPAGVPRAFSFADNNGTNGSDVLVIKSIAANINRTTRKWSLMFDDGGNCRVKSWGRSDLDFLNGERVIVIDDERRMLLAVGTNWKLSFVDNNCTNLPHPTVGINLVYGIDDDNETIPFNRVDYYLNTSNPFPSRCFPGSFILNRATINQSNGARLARSLIDCVMDFQVAFGLDTNGDGGVDAWTSNLTLDAEHIRAQVRELRIFVLYHEGAKDDRFRFSGTLNLGDVQIASNPNFQTLSNAPQAGALSTYTPAGDAARYRWKVAKLVVKPMNLDASGP